MSSPGDMDDMDKDSEFDSELEDLEFHLYQQLYFETNSDIVEERHDGKSISETCDKQFAQLDGCQQNHVHDPKHMPHTVSTTTSKIDEAHNHQFDSCIYINTLEGAELTLTDFAVNLNTRNAENHLITQKGELHADTSHKVSLSDDVPLWKKNRMSLQSARERLSSTCSDGSIPGSVPLDVLYCNLVTSDEEEEDVIIENRLIMKNIETNNQERNKEKSNKRKRRKASCSDDEEDSRCNNLINAASKNAVNEGAVQLGEDSNSDDDVYVLPPPKLQKPEILTLESSSDNEVEAGSRDGTCEKSNHNKYRKIEKPPSSALTTRNKEGKSKGMHQISESRGKQDRKEEDSTAAESESDSCDVDMPEATKGTDLTLNIDKKLSGWIKTITKDADTPKKKKKIAKKPPNKKNRPSVDFTKGRPNTTTIPSCEKWTQSMANFYDSDVSDDFDVSEILFQQSGSRADWHLIAADYQINHRRRYYNAPERCKRCRQDGHMSNKCPRVPVCHLCSKTDHLNRTNCPENCCFKCGGEPHYFCPITDLSRTCNLCGSPGHHKEQCPDLWRRFHLTTDGLTVQAPTVDTTRPLRERYCYSCGKQGHYGHECPIRFQNRSYGHVPQSVVSYCCPVNVVDGYFTVNVDREKLIPTEENVTTMPIKSKDAGRIIGKKGAMVKSIIKASGAHVRVVQEGRPQVLLFGPPEARLKAQEIIDVLLRKRMTDGCVNVMEPLKNINNSYSMPISSGTSDSNSLTSDNGTSNSNCSQNNSWSGQFLINHDRRKHYVLKEMKALIKRLRTKKNINLTSSLKKLKDFRLRRESMPSVELSANEKKQLSIIAMNALGNGSRINKKLSTLFKLVQSCHSSIVPKNICVQIADTVQPFLDPPLEKLDELLQHAKNNTDAYLKKKALERKKANKSKMKLKFVVPNENKNINVIPNEKKKKKKKIKATKKEKAKKNEYASEAKKKINPGKKKRRQIKVTAMRKKASQRTQRKQ